MLVYGEVPTGLPPMVNTADSLTRAGHQVELVHVAPPAGSRPSVPVRGVQITSLPIWSRRLFHALFGRAPRLAAIAALQYGSSYAEFVTKAIVAALRSRADLYEANDLPALPPAVVAAWLRGKPVVFRAHELWSESAPKVRFASVWRFLERVLVPRCDMVVTPDEHRSRIYDVELGARRPPLTIRNCPPYRAPMASTRLRDELCRRGITPSAIVLYQGLVDSARCIEEIADAARLFDPGAVLVIMGTGYGKWANPAAVLAKYEHIVVLPPVPYSELVPFTASADIGILLYRNDCRNNYYCAPNKLFEYMMMGLPIVAANYPGMVPLVEDTGVGLCVDPTSPAGIAAAVNRLASDPERRARMRETGLRLSRERYSWEIESVPLVQAYDTLMSH